MKEGNGSTRHPNPSAHRPRSPGPSPSLLLHLRPAPVFWGWNLSCPSGPGAAALCPCCCCFLCSICRTACRGWGRLYRMMLNLYTIRSAPCPFSMGLSSSPSLRIGLEERSSSPSRVMAWVASRDRGALIELLLESTLLPINSSLPLSNMAARGLRGGHICPHSRWWMPQEDVICH